MPPGVAVRAALLAVAFAIGPLLALGERAAFGGSPPLAMQVVVQLAYCVLAIGFVWMALRVERLPLSAIGLHRPGLSTMAVAAVLLVLTLFVLPALTSPLVDRLGPERRDLAVRDLGALPIWFRIVLAVTGGAIEETLYLAVTGGAIEETLYRGYAFGRLEAMAESRWRAGVIVVAVFTLAHVPLWGVVYSIVAVLPFSVLMTAAYAWRRDLLANSTAHSLGLVVGLLRI